MIRDSGQGRVTDAVAGSLEASGVHGSAVKLGQGLEGANVDAIVDEFRDDGGIDAVVGETGTCCRVFEGYALCLYSCHQECDGEQSSFDDRF